jgi:phosphoribosylanthranilate isomerase
MPPVRIKICCIASIQEMRLAVDAGANAIGLVSAMPSGPGPIDEISIASIAEATPPAVATFLLTCRQDTRVIANQIVRCRTNTVQICDCLTSGSYADIRRACPSVKIVQVIHVTGPESIAEARSISPHVDAILLDSGRPSLATKELGGTGRTHDWTISRQIREQVDVPVFLAGGLNASNVAGAISTVRPFGVDICSGVRTDNRLDPQKLCDFIAQTRSVAAS